MKRTKIVCTIGPASDNSQTLEALINAGMDVARLNFSHGNHESHGKLIELIREISKKANKPVGILADLCGPKIRTGKLKEKTIELETGSEVIISTEISEGHDNIIATDYENLHTDVEPGNRILIADGELELRVKEIKDNNVYCEVVNGGILGERKGINLPGTEISSPSVTPKDYEDLDFILTQNVDYVALSFVRTSKEIKNIKKYIHKNGGNAQVIAKIERPEAVENIESIIRATDGIMVARGDLGVELDVATVPLIQKRIIELCRLAEKPVITATQMLDSMISAPLPTRAEVTDVSNAIFDGTDAIMLSGETASGKYPINAVKMMARIAINTEEYIRETNYFHKYWGKAKASSIEDAISDSAASIADRLDINLILAATNSGKTARLASKNRPEAPILALTHRKETLTKMTLYWGVTPVLIPDLKSFEKLFMAGSEIAIEQNFAKMGDEVIFISGYPLGRSGVSNTIQIRRIDLIKATSKTVIKKVIRKETSDFVFFLDQDLCVGCGVCAEGCPSGIYEIENSKANFHTENLNDCTGDLKCMGVCPSQAIKIIKVHEK